MKDKEAKKTKKCSVCRRPGHIKTHCPTMRREGRLKSAPKGVMVKVAKAHQKSPHLVDLSGRIEKPEWHGVRVFQEAPRVKEDRAVIDWAKMVRGANQSANIKYRITATNRKNLLSVICHLESVIKNVRIRPIILYQSSLNRLNAIFQSFDPRRLAYGMVAVFLLIALPFPVFGYYQKLKSDNAQIVSNSTEAFLALQSSAVAALQANIPQAQSDLNSALQSFSSAQDILDREYGALMYVTGLLPVIGSEVKSRQHLLSAGHHLALGNTYLIKGLSESGKKNSLLEKIGILSDHMRSAVPQYREALAELAGVDARSLPAEFQQSFIDFKLLFATFIDDIADLQQLSKSLNFVFGGEQPRRYLLVFQNNAEIRPTGGFMGSFGVLDMLKGKVVNLDVPGGGTYDLQGQLDAFVKPPLPLQLVNKRWEFHDSNWFPDFSASAKKIEWFYQHGRGATVDGVIALNASVLERLLRVLGPVQSQILGSEVTSGDAVAKIQKHVEIDYGKENNKPKEVVSELAQELVERSAALNASSAMRALSELHEALVQKEIQMFFNDTEVQSQFSRFGWTGELAVTPENHDYLLVVNANLGGNKTDARIEQEIEHQAVVREDGSVIDTVVIRRHNIGGADEMFYGGNNVSYVRVYVPSGSELIDAGGFSYPPEEFFNVPEDWYKDDADLSKHEQEIAIHAGTGTRITNEFGKMAFGNWLVVGPGQTGSVYFTYRLPFRVVNGQQDRALSFWTADMVAREASRYGLFLQKQSGADSRFSTRVIYPQGWTPAWSNDDDAVFAANGAEFDGILETDKLLGIVMERQEE